MSDVDEIPGPIIKAIAAIKAHTEAVKKSQFNKHGGYHFASTDDIYAAVARKMGDVGLVTIPLELKNERVTIDVPDKGRNGELQYDKHENLLMKKSHWLDVEVGFILAVDGATWFDKRNKRTEFVQYTGPQSAQAVVSFAEKAFLRSLFKLPTGDMDVDSMPQGDTLEDQVTLAQPAKRKSSHSAKKDGETVAVFEEIQRHIKAAYGDSERLIEIRKLYADEWRTMPVKWAQILEDEFEDAFGSSRNAAE